MTPAAAAGRRAGQPGVRHLGGRQLAGLHAQTLRSYDRLGLVSPGRSAGGGRRYSARDIALLREVQRLSQEEGVNLAGIKRIIELEQLVDELHARLDELAQELLAARAAAEQAAASVHASYRRDLVPVERTRPSSCGGPRAARPTRLSGRSVHRERVVADAVERRARHQHPATPWPGSWRASRTPARRGRPTRRTG